MGALSPRRRRCSSVLQKESRAGRNVLLRGSFCGLRYNPIRIQRLFLPTFSGKTEKVGLRSNGCGVAALTAPAVFPAFNRRSGETGKNTSHPLRNGWRLFCVLRFLVGRLRVFVAAIGHDNAAVRLGAGGERGHVGMILKGGMDDMALIGIHRLKGDVAAIA